MALERKWLAVPATSFTADGTDKGIVTIPDTAGFYTKSKVQISSDTLQPIALQVQQVLSPTQLVVGPRGPLVGRQNFHDISGYTVADNAQISAIEQDKSNIPDKDHYVAVYEADPIVADRVIEVDKHGNPYSYSNPVPVNIISLSQIPFTLTSLALPALLSDLVSQLTYDNVRQTTSGNQEILSFYSSDTLLTSVTLTRSSSGWILDIGALPLDYLLLESGDMFTLEDNSGSILLE